MASVMGICGGLAGPKSGNVEKTQVFACFFADFTNRGASTERLTDSEPRDFRVILGSLWGRLATLG